MRLGGNYQNVKTRKVIGKNEEEDIRLGDTRHKTKRNRSLDILSCVLSLFLLFHRVINDVSSKIAAYLAHKRFSGLILILAESSIG